MIVQPAAARRAGVAGRSRRPDYARAMVEAWKRALILAPHTDDGELGCGGTTARLVEAGGGGREVALSIAPRPPLPGVGPGNLPPQGRAGGAARRGPPGEPPGGE